MSGQLSRRIMKLPVSQTLAMTQKAREMRAEGLDIINLSIGEPDFNTPEFIKEAAIKAIRDNYHAYTPVNGYLELREAISRKFARDNGLHYTPDQIVVSTGAKQSLANIVMSLVNPGDEIILPAPYWVSYEALVRLSEAKLVSITAGIEQDYKITPAQLEEVISDRTKLLFINSPNNPSGSVYTPEEMEGIAAILRKYPHVYIISDEIYEHINYGTKTVSFASLDGMYERTITVNGVSKAFSMTGWRIGYMGAPLWIAKACTKMQGQITSGANCIAQQAAISALEAPVESIKYMIDEFDKRRQLIKEQLDNIPGFKTNDPMGAFYIFPDISYYFGKELEGRTILNATDFSLFLLEKAHVATVPGEAFGIPGCLRLSYASSRESLTEAIKRIHQAVTQT